jgi:CHAT domain-containing protein
MRRRCFSLSVALVTALAVCCPSGIAQSQPANAPQAAKPETSDPVRKLIRDGEAERLHGNLAAALAIFQTARQTAEKASDELGVATALLNIGLVETFQGKSRESFEALEAGLKIAKAKDDKQLIVTGLKNRGNAYTATGQFPQALADYKEALGIAESLPDKKWVPALLRNIGDINEQLGNHDEALSCFQKSLAMLESDGSDTRGIASSLERIGVIYQRQANSGTALEYFQRSLAIPGTDRNKDLSRHLFNDIGQVYESFGDFEQALNYYQKSLAVAKEVGDERGQATALENIGLVEQEQGVYPAAARDFGKSLELFQKTDTKDGVLALLSNLGEVEYALGNFEKALEYQRKSETLAESLGDQENLSVAEAYTALIYNKQQKFHEALSHAKRAAEIAERLGSKDVLWPAQNISGVAYQGLGQTEHAKESFLAAIATVEQLRTEVAGGEEQQQSFLSSRLEPYYGLVDLLNAQQQPAEALRYAELAKGRALLDVLQNGKVQITKAMTPSEREREQQLQTEMSKLNRQVEEENAQEKPDARRLADLQGRVEAAQLRYQDFQTNLYAIHPELKTRRGLAQPVSLQEMAQLLPDAKSAFLEFTTGEEKTYLFVLTRQENTGPAEPQLKVYTVPLSNKLLKERAERFREQLGQRDLAFKTTAHELFRTLIEPARAQLAGKTALVIVPDGPLWNLPFQALLEDNNRYMLEDYAIAYAPSLTVLREMTKARPEDLASVASSPMLMAMADPVLRKQTVQRASISYRGETLGPLPEAKQEAVNLKQLYGSDLSKVYTGAEAGEDRFKAEAGQFRVLHLATHGVFNDANPMHSHLLLSTGEPDSKEDGLLEAWEILQMDLHADLVVLSACETARGRISAGEGVIGLTWAFFVAGAPTTVVSQWKVESASTANLMLAFHRNFRARNSAGAPEFSTARALQRAEVHLLHTPQYAHPFYWAGFIVVGNPQ